MLRYLLTRKSDWFPLKMTSRETQPSKFESQRDTRSVLNNKKNILYSCQFRENKIYKCFEVFWLKKRSTKNAFKNRNSFSICLRRIREWINSFGKKKLLRVWEKKRKFWSKIFQNISLSDTISQIHLKIFKYI